MSQHLQVVVAQKEDLASIIEFDREVLEQKSMFGLIHLAKPEYYSYFKVNNIGWKIGEVLLVKENDKIQAKLSLGVKNIFYEEKEVKAGYLFDLQHKFIKREQNGDFSKSQKEIENLQTIFKVLIEEAVQNAIKKYQVQILYTPVKGFQQSSSGKSGQLIFQEILEQNDNDENNKNYGFQKSGERMLSVCSIANADTETDQISWNLKLSNDSFAAYKFLQENNKIITHMEESYGPKHNFYLPEFRYDFLGNEAYKGCYTLTTTDKKNIAGIHLFEEKQKTQALYLKYLLKPEHFNHDFFQIFVQVFLGINLIILMLFLVKIGIHLIIATLFILFVYFYVQHRLDRIIIKIMNKNSSYLRAVGPFFTGDEELEEEMFSKLIANICLEKHLAAHRNMRANLEVDGKFTKHFKNKNKFANVGINAAYLMKFTDPEIKMSKSVNFFFDPKDI